MMYLKKKYTNPFWLLIISFYLPEIRCSLFPNAYQEELSKTNLKTRPLSSYGMPLVDAQMAMPLAKENLENTKTAALYCIGIGSMSHSDSNFADYFSIGQKRVMSIKGDNAPNKESRDIRAEYVGGDQTTDLEVSLAGKSDISGVKFLVQLSLEEMTKHPFFHNWFVSIRGAVSRTEHQLSLEKNLSSQSNDFLSIKNFFSFTTPNAKINGQNYSAIGLENLTITLDGLYTSKHNSAEIYYYTGLEIPTSSDNNATKTLFYPTIGNNGFIGLIAGGDFHIFLHNWKKQRIGFLLEIENHFLLYKTVNRVFDLYQNSYPASPSSQAININKPWSRYLPVINLSNQAEIETTVAGPSNLPIRIHPCNNLDVSAGLLYEIGMCNETRWIFALGYNLWMSQPEYIELQDRVYPKEYKHFYQYGIMGSDNQHTASRSTISTAGVDDLAKINFDYLSLDYSSAASDGGYSNTVFFRGSFLGNSGVSFLLGAWYEIGKKQVIPSRTGGWIGLGYEY